MKMRTSFLLLLAAVNLVPPVLPQLIVDSDTAFRVDSRRPERIDNSARIEALLRRMTIEEKSAR